MPCSCHEVLAVLRDLGSVIETDWRPNRVQLVALVIDDDGTARQSALGGGWHEFPRAPSLFNGFDLKYPVKDLAGGIYGCLSATGSAVMVKPRG